MFMSKIGTTAAFLLSLASSSASAQWLNYPTPGIPRTKDGKPNLVAPAPRSSDRKPDLSGMWSIAGLGAATNITDVEMLPAAQSLYRTRLETYANDDPAVGCLPEGPRTGLAGLDPFRLVQSRNMTIVLHETGTYRVIHTDGRSLPKDMNPTWMGYSVGRWEGDTFVVTTAGYNDKTWLDFAGHPHSESLRLTERFRRTDFGHMQVEMTFEDPKTYVTPFTLKLTANFVPDDDLIENVCLENEKDHGRLVGKIVDEQKTGTKVSASVLAEYAGKYDLGPFGVWTISNSGDQLLVEVGDGGGKQPVMETADNVFVLPSVGGTLTFVRDPKKRNIVTHFVLTIVEGDFKADRK
jgi:hypothetical protein